MLQLRFSYNTCGVTHKWKHTVTCGISIWMDVQLYFDPFTAARPGMPHILQKKPGDTADHLQLALRHPLASCAQEPADVSLLCCPQVTWSFKGGPAVMLLGGGFGLLCPKWIQFAHLRCHSLAS